MIMRCSLKNGFVILLIFFLTLSEGKVHSFRYKNSIADRSINFNDILAMSRVEQSLDSFPNLGDYDKNAHKIVKKQMTPLDYKHKQMNKRSAFSLQGSVSCEDDDKCKYREKREETTIGRASDEKYNRKRSVLPESASKKQSDFKVGKKFFTDAFKNGEFLRRRSTASKKQKNKKVAENDTQQTEEKKIENTVEKPKDIQKETENSIKKLTQNTVEKSTAKAIEKDLVKESEKAAEKDNEKAAEKHNEKALEKAKEKVKEDEKLKNKASNKKSEVQVQIKDLEEQNKFLKSMVGCKMENYCRFPDVHDNHSYFECESDCNGCIKLTHKSCPGDEIFSSKFLECVKPFFWKLVEREKRSLWKKKQKQKHSNSWTNEQPPNAWTDVTKEETKQFPSEFRIKNKPKLVLYHLKVKKAVNEELRCGKKQQRHALSIPRFMHTEASKKFLQHGSKKYGHHQLYPRSFIIRINKKEGKNDHEESLSENDKDKTEDDIDDDDEEEEEEEDDDEGDDEDSEETNDEKDNENDDEDKKSVEKGGIKEFFKSAKESITNKARFSEPADTSFTLDKTNPYSNRKLENSEKDSKKILIDADIKVDKTLGKTLKRILGKRKNKDDDKVLLNGSLLSDRADQDQVVPEQIRMYENLIRSNPRLKRYFLASLCERDINRRL